MAGGSQLTQLKSAIHGAGLARSNSSGSKKKRAGGGSGGKAKSSMGDPEARKKKLEVGRDVVAPWLLSYWWLPGTSQRAKPAAASRGEPRAVS